MILSTRNTPIVCGLLCHSMRIDSHQEFLDIATYDDPLARLPLESSHTARFEFLLTRDNARDLDRLFPIGYGQCATHYLGPSDVCEYCGSAWLPGTLRCESCGAETNHFTQAIEYQADNTGIITQRTQEQPFDGVGFFTVEIEFSHLVLSGPPERMFEHSLWRNAPAVWVCRFCGFVVQGRTSDCPGCGGKRYKLDELMTQRRVCVYCGLETWGNYACPSCNQRLLAVPEFRRERQGVL